MKKNLLPLLLCVGLCSPAQRVWAQTISAANVTSQSADAKAAAKTVTLTGTLTTGANGDFRQLRDLCWQMQTLNLGSASCTDIPKNALHSRHNLRSLTLPSNVQTIGSQAFYACDSVQGTVKIPQSTKSIGASCFSNCKKVTAFSVPANSNLVNIGSYAFQGCESLAGTFTVPSKVMVLRDGVFEGCKRLTGVSLPSNLQSIGANAFSGCESLSGDIALGRMITRIGASAFADCKSLTAISMPRALQQLGDAAFMNCSSLSGTITIPGSIVSLGKGAFSGCKSVESFVLPEELTEIKAATFAGCTGLKTIIVGASVPPAIDATAFAGINCASVQLIVPEGTEHAYSEAAVWKEFKISEMTDIKEARAAQTVSVNVDGNTLTVKNAPASALVQLFNANGQLLQNVQNADELTDVRFTLNTVGVYVVKVNGKSYKVNY